MADADSTETLAMLVYPALWAASRETHPRGPAYCWKAHLRDLCRLARELHRQQPVALKVSGLAEQMHIGALADVPVEILILDIERDRLSRPGLPADPLWWLDPFDSHLLKSKPAPVGQVRPGAHI
jgi:hypothetical protein